MNFKKNKQGYYKRGEEIPYTCSWESIASQYYPLSHACIGVLMTGPYDLVYNSFLLRNNPLTICLLLAESIPPAVSSAMQGCFNYLKGYGRILKLVTKKSILIHLY
jgi:hypothetical protein